MKYITKGVKSNLAPLKGSRDYIYKIGGIRGLRFVEDLAGSIYDLFKFLLTSLSYIMAGMLIVGIPMFLFIFVFNWLFNV